MVKKNLKKSSDTLFGAATLLQSSRLLSDQSLGTGLSASQNIIGIGVTKAVSDKVFDLTMKKRRKKKKKRGV